MAARSKKSRSAKRKAPRSHWVDYLLAFSIAFLVILVLGFVYVDDVRDGLGIFIQTVADRWFPDVF